MMPHAAQDERRFPRDEARMVEGLTEPEVVALLCRDGTCPEWIDIHPEAVGPGVTVFRLLCCGRFTADSAKLYYTSRALGPFGIKSPALPHKFREGDRGSR